MSKQVINIGTTPNDSTGSTLRAAGDLINDNFTELYNIHGWGYYKDGEIVTPTQVITTTPALLSIDGAHATSNSDFLPGEIIGSTELWDVAADHIVPIGFGDSYNLRVDLSITAKGGLPTELIFELDVSGAAAPTTVIVERIISTGKTPPYTVSVGFPVFCLESFIANGGQIFLSTDTGTVTVASRAIMITRTSKGGL